MLWMILIWIHVLAAMFWVGGMLFFSIVLIPSLRKMPVLQRAELMSEIGRRFRWSGWISLGVLLTTGLLRLYSLEFQEIRMGGWLGTKLALIALMIALTLLHDIVLGPRSIQISRSAAAPHPLQRTVRWMARLNLVVGLFVVLAAVYVARGY
ncbi:DUF4149 domain-containing protein [Nitrospiraceae bacterium HYJII51-Mn-bac16s-1-B09]|uniref:DUF4149 domain-containing protein n=2 Tax=Candidatus Manganitrophus noduliformans TaxID=2606439 RepID=A0A7X6IAX9_9BACT|nr:DUF4149 domain-containing protein [Candidatus Manganitrophus noduliformans]